MKLFLWTLGTTSVVWLCVVIAIIARYSKKIVDLQRNVKQWKFNCEALQKEFQRWSKANEKMETGNANSDFLGSLDILSNPKG